MQTSEVFAVVGLIFTILNNIPQIYTTVTTQQTGDINTASLFLRMFSTIAYTVYAIKLDDSLLLSSLGISCFSVALLLLYKIRNLISDHA